MSLTEHGTTISPVMLANLGSIVPAEGPKNARIVIVGEAPGHEEAIGGRPFISGAGRFLDSALISCGLRRSDCYLTNVVKQRPPSNDFGVFYVDTKRNQPSDYLVRCQEGLLAEIAQVRPNVIIALGDEALRALTGRRGITKWRGSILSSSVGKVVPSLHPAFVLRTFSSHPLLYADLKRAAKEAASPDVSLPRFDFVIQPTAEQTIAWFDKAEAELAAKGELRLSFDIETLGECIRCLGLGYNGTGAICIPFVKFMNDVGGLFGSDTIIPLTDTGGSFGNYFTSDEEYEILRRINRLFANPQVKLIGQNLPFDTVLLARTFGFTFASIWMDTMLAQHTCYAELPKGLDTLVSLYTRIPYYSDYNSSSDNETFVYNCYDVVGTWLCAEALEKELQQNHLTEFYFNHVNNVLQSVIRIENRGVFLDGPRRKELRTDFESKLSRIVKDIRDIVAWPDLNPNSDKQLKELLYDKLGMKPQINRKTKQPSTDKNAIIVLRRQYPQYDALFELLKQHSELSTLISGVLSKDVSSDGRIRTHFNVGGTVTRRLASSQPLFGAGTNLQNIPIRTANGRLIRQCFISDRDWLMLKCDLSQAEFRIVCWLAKIERIIRRYSENPDWDVHRWVASILYRKPESEVLDKPERSTAKNGVYGGNYKMMPPRAAQVYEMPLKTAEWVLKEYRKAIPEIPQWWSSVDETVQRTRKIVSPTGGVRYFFDRIDDDLFRSAYSASAQAIVSDIINRAMIVADELFDPNECHVLLQIHDELLFQSHISSWRKYVPLIVRCMEYPLYFPGIEQPLIIPPEVSFGWNWVDQTKVKQPFDRTYVESLELSSQPLGAFNATDVTNLIG